MVYICPFFLFEVACLVLIKSLSLQVPRESFFVTARVLSFLHWSLKGQTWTLKAFGLEDAKKMTQAIISKLIKSCFPNSSVLHGRALPVLRKASNSRAMLTSFLHELNTEVIGNSAVLSLGWNQ